MNKKQKLPKMFKKKKKDPNKQKKREKYSKGWRQIKKDKLQEKE